MKLWPYLHMVFLPRGDSTEMANEKRASYCSESMGLGYFLTWVTVVLWLHNFTGLS